MRDLSSLLTTIKGIVVGAKSANTTVNGTGHDLANRDYAMIVIHVEAWTDGTHTPKMQESSDNSTYTDVAAGDQVGSFTAISSNAAVGTKQEVSYIGKQRYIRTALTTAGATTGMVIGADCVTSGARKQPQ